MAKRKKKNKSSVKDVIEPHSQAKLDFYKYYLNRYLPILYLSDFITRINIFDIFCGTGVYKDGKFGSPIIAYNEIINVKNQYKDKTSKVISLTVNDGKSEKIENVKSYFNSIETNTDFISYNNLDSDTMFAEIIGKIEKQNRDEKNLIFIDPYGYKDIKKQNIIDLLKKQNTEIILFLPISHMYRFTDIAIQSDEPAYAKLRIFVEEFFESNHPYFSIESGKDVFKYIYFIKNALTFNNKYFSASYYIQRNNANYFALFFITPNIYGLEKILKVKWSLDEKFGQGFKQKDPLGDLFEEEYKKESLRELIGCFEEKLISWLKSGSFTNSDVYRFTLGNEFLPKHTNQILKKMQESQILEVESVRNIEKVRKNSFYVNKESLNKDSKLVKFILKS